MHAAPLLHSARGPAHAPCQARSLRRPALPQAKRQSTAAMLRAALLCSYDNFQRRAPEEVASPVQTAVVLHPSCQLAWRPGQLGAGITARGTRPAHATSWWQPMAASGIGGFGPACRTHMPRWCVSSGGFRPPPWRSQRQSSTVAARNLLRASRQQTARSSGGPRAFAIAPEPCTHNQDLSAPLAKLSHARAGRRAAGLLVLRIVTRQSAHRAKAAPTFHAPDAHHS
jgi:hypothetical protein